VRRLKPPVLYTLATGGAVAVILLPPDSPLLLPGERGFNFRTVRTDASRRVATDFLGGPTISLPTEVPIAVADTSGALGGDGKGPILISLDAPTQIAPPSTAYPDGRLQVDQLGTTSRRSSSSITACARSTPRWRPTTSRSSRTPTARPRSCRSPTSMR
jgi:hypothetical protein